jgi:aryl-alcohol dehydrogenase-like predicted oxidoreductase
VLDEPVVNAVQELAGARDATTAQVALAWGAAQHSNHGPSWY